MPADERQRQQQQQQQQQQQRQQQEQNSQSSQQQKQQQQQDNQQEQENEAKNREQRGVHHQQQEQQPLLRASGFCQKRRRRRQRQQQPINGNFNEEYDEEDSGNICSTALHVCVRLKHQMFFSDNQQQLQQKRRNEHYNHANGDNHTHKEEDDDEDEEEDISWISTATHEASAALDQFCYDTFPFGFRLLQITMKKKEITTTKNILWLQLFSSSSSSHHQQHQHQHDDEEENDDDGSNNKNKKKERSFLRCSSSSSSSSSNSAAVAVRLYRWNNNNNNAYENVSPVRGSADAATTDHDEDDNDVGRKTINNNNNNRHDDENRKMRKKKHSSSSSMSSSDSLSESSDSSSSVLLSSSSLPVVYVSSLTAANLGWLDQLLTPPAAAATEEMNVPSSSVPMIQGCLSLSHPTIINDSGGTTDGVHPTRRVGGMVVEDADRVILKCWRRPVVSSLFSSSSPTTTTSTTAATTISREDGDDVEDETLPLPPAGSLLQVGKLIGVPMMNKSKKKMKQFMVIYQVVQIQCGSMMMMTTAATSPQIATTTTKTTADLQQQQQHKNRPYNHSVVVAAAAQGTKATRYSIVDEIAAAAAAATKNTDDDIETEAEQLYLNFGLSSSCCSRLPPFVTAANGSPPPHPDTFKLISALSVAAAAAARGVVDSGGRSAGRGGGGENGFDTVLPSSSFSPSHCILHYPGNLDDHHISVAVQTAAHAVGRTYLLLQYGWATTAYLHHHDQHRRRRRYQQQQQRPVDISSNKNDESSNNTNNNKIDDKPPLWMGNGGWVDKLHGLRCALRQAKHQYAPCVLHLVNVDREMSNFKQQQQSGSAAAGDVQDDEAQESRVWSLLIQELSSSSSSSNSMMAGGSTSARSTSGKDFFEKDGSVGTITSLGRSNLSLHTTPPVLVVVSTTASYLPPNGAFANNIVFSSIPASYPDDKYIDFLWNRINCNDDNISSSSNNNNKSSFPLKISCSNVDGQDTQKVNNQFTSNRIGIGKVDYPTVEKDDDNHSDFRNDGVAIFTEPIKRLLRGRSANEIVFLLLEFDKLLGQTRTSKAASLGGNSAEGRDPTKLLETLCFKHDNERRHQSGMMARIPTVQWKDVGGLAHVRKEILDRMELPLKFPLLFPSSSGGGILLFGPPGSGKTLVAKAVATECNLPFLSVKGPELLGSYVGESESNLRSVFEQARHLARHNQPPASILFFDELDSLAPHRGESASGGNVMDRVVATLFAELDRGGDSAVQSEDFNDDLEGPGSAGSSAVFCIGATNRPDLLDPALLRPGRFDRLVYLGISNSCEETSRILQAQFRKLRLRGDRAHTDEVKSTAAEMADVVARHLVGSSTTVRFSGADLSTIATVALERATKRLCDEADQELQKRREEQGEMWLTLDDVLDSWGDDHLEPKVTLEDLIEASNCLIPSVTEEDLKRYESLRDQFQVS